MRCCRAATLEISQVEPLLDKTSPLSSLPPGLHPLGAGFVWLGLFPVELDWINDELVPDAAIGLWEIAEQYIQCSRQLMDTWEQSEPWNEDPAHRQKAIRHARDTLEGMQKITEHVDGLAQKIARAWWTDKDTAAARDLFKQLRNEQPKVRYGAIHVHQLAGSDRVCHPEDSDLRCMMPPSRSWKSLSTHAGSCW